MSLESLKIQGECRKREREEQTDVNRKGIKMERKKNIYPRLTSPIPTPRSGGLAAASTMVSVDVYYKVYFMTELSS